MRWYSSSSWLGGQFSLQRMASSLVVSRSLSFGRTLMLSVMVSVMFLRLMSPDEMESSSEEVLPSRCVMGGGC